MSQSVFDASFLDVVRAWFTMSNNIFVVVRYSRMAGAKDYFWFSDYAPLDSLLHRLPPQTEVIAFRDNQFPLHGVVDDSFIQQVLALIPENTEAMISDSIAPSNARIDITICESHSELLESLRELTHMNIVVGLYAPWHDNDNERMISALVPSPDGTLKRGIY